MRVLIVKIGALGDTVMALSMLSGLQGAHITWVSGKIPAPLLDHFKVDRLIVVDEKRLYGGSLRAFFSLWRKIGFRRYDKVIIGHCDVRYRLLTLFTWGKRKIFSPRKGHYHGDEYGRLVTAASTQLPFWGDAIPRNKTVVLAPGGSLNPLSEDPLRRWPIEYYVELAQKLLQKGVPVLLTGGPTDSWVSAHFKEMPVLDKIGKTTLPELVALYQSCALLITHDSGPLHIAKLARCPTIALFGPVSPRERVRESTVHVLHEPIPCSPCYNGKTYAPCTNNLCMKSITPDKVLGYYEGYYSCWGKRESPLASIDAGCS